MRTVYVGNKLFLLQTEKSSLVSLKRQKRHQPKPPICQVKVNKEANLLFWTNFSMKQVDTIVFSFDLNSVGIS